MKRILIDVDDVITNTGKTFIKLINDYLNSNYQEEDNQGFYLQDLLGDKKESFFKEFDKVDLYKEAEVYQDCIEILKELNEVYDIYFCSAFVYNDAVKASGINLKSKYDFLIRNFPFIDPNKFIFTTNKSIMDCDIRIDDRIENLDNAELKLLYTAYHNKDINNEELKKKNIIRVNNWLDIKRVLLKK